MPHYCQKNLIFFRWGHLEMKCPSSTKIGIDETANIYRMPTTLGIYTSPLQITDVTRDEEECEVVNDGMNFFPAPRHQFQKRQ